MTRNHYETLVAELPPEIVTFTQAREQAGDLLQVAAEWVDSS